MREDPIVTLRLWRGQLIVLLVIASCIVGMARETGGRSSDQTRETVTIRGQPQSLRLYGARGGIPVIVSSGDGGWIHLGPHVAEVLAAHGFFVVGLDVKAYLERFTSGTATLRPEDEPGDFEVIANFAARGSRAKPIFIGVSEGAGLSVLAASDPRIKSQIAGVIGLGLPDRNELGWRWKDGLIYLTHGIPNEPTFSTAAIVDRVAPVPLAAIHSTHDEFVPVAEVQRLLDRAKEPKKLWIVEAGDHRFSDNLAEFDRCLLEAINWITQHSAR
jgi:alpha-beta hydrolase superfamily lysophospholipase